MSLTDRYAQSPRKRRNPYSGRRESVSNPVVRTAQSSARAATFVEPSVQRRTETFSAAPRTPQPVRPETQTVPDSRAQMPPVAYEQPFPKPILSVELVLAGLWRYRGLTAALVLLFALAGAVGMTMLPRKYTAEVSIYFDPKAIELAQTNPQAPPVSPEAISATIDSQTQILTSRVILTRVAKQLGLNRDPEFLAADDQSASENDIPSSVIEKLTAAAVSKRTQNSYVVTLMVTSKNGRKSADIANAIVEEFIAEEQSSLTGLYSTASSVMGTRLVDLAAEVKLAEQAIEDYKSKNDLVTADGNLIADKRLVSINEALLTAQNKTIQSKARVDSVAKLGLEATGADKDAAENTSTELSNLRRQYSEQAAKVGSLQSQLGSRHPVLLAAKASLDDIAKLVKAEQDRVLEKAKAQLQQAQQTEDDVSKQLNLQKALQAGAANRLVGLKELQRRLDAARTQYDTLVKRANDTGDKSNSTYNNIRVISEAAPPAKANGPGKSILMVAGGFGGIMFGLIIAALFSLMMLVRTTSPTRPESGLRR